MSKNNFHNKYAVEKPKRIISLVPSISELLFNLGLDEEVIGITKFCLHPVHWFKTKTRIGGTKNINIEKIKLLQPDLIIASKEENIKEQVEALQQTAPVWLTDISTFSHALEMVDDCGKITGKEEKANEITDKIKSSFNQPSLPVYRHNDQPPTLYLIWRNPYMTIGGDTFVHDMLRLAGFTNIYGHLTRYPSLTIKEIVNANPAYIFLSSEPFPFKQKHIDELQQYLPQSKIILVDGEMFSWYGSRMMYAAEYFEELKLKII